MLGSQIDSYFESLGQGAPVRCLQTFKDNVSARFSNPLSSSRLIKDFYWATRVGSLSQEINLAACSHLTRRVHHTLSRKTLSLCKSINNQWDELSSDDLERILLAHKRIQTKPSQDIVEKWVDTTYQKLDGMSADWLARCAGYLADLGIYPSDKWMEQWSKTLKSKSADLSWEKGFKLLYKIALLDYLRQYSLEGIRNLNDSPCAVLAKMLLDIIELKHETLFSDKIDSRVYYAALWFKKDFIDKLPIQPSNERRSRLEKTVYGLMREANLEVDEDGIKIGKTEHKIDLRVHFANVDFGCEVDGVLHFTAVPHDNPKEGGVTYNSSTRFHADLTRSLCPNLKILRVPYFVIEGTKVAPLPWEKIFGKLNRQTPSHFSLMSGSYIRDMDGITGHLFKGREL